MSNVDALLTAYARHVAIPWERDLAGQQRVWFLVHEPPLERQIRFGLERFRQATTQAGHGWATVDLAGMFGRWLEGERYRNGYFRNPTALTDHLDAFGAFVAEQIRPALTPAASPEGTVVALIGASSLYGLTSISALIETLAPSIAGRLLVFFPGQRHNATYHLMGTGDGWNYLAIPITASDGV